MSILENREVFVVGFEIYLLGDFSHLCYKEDNVDGSGFIKIGSLILTVSRSVVWAIIFRIFLIILASKSVKKLVENCSEKALF